MNDLVRLRFLGPAQVERGDQAVERLAPGKMLALLGYLAVRDQPVPRERLADLLWPDLPASRGRANLSWLLNKLTGLLPGCLDADRHSLQFKRGPPYSLDLDAFADLVGRGDAAALAEAVALYRGDLLEGLHLDGCAGFEVWLVGKQERWRRRAVRALRELVAGHERRGEHKEALRYARRLLALEPWLEEAHRQVMGLLALGGRRAAALAQYEACRSVPAEELGVEPGPETVRLYEQICDGELAGPAPAPPPTPPGGMVPRVPQPTGTLTHLFTDIEGSTELWERCPEAMQAALARHDAIVRGAVAAHGGHVVKATGDGFYAVFGTAPDALAAALAAQRGLHAEAWDEAVIRVRMGLDTGAADERDGDYFGPALSRAARLMAAGHGGQILLSQATRELVRDQLPAGVGLRDLGVCRLKGLARPEQVCQVVAAGLPAEFPPLATLEARPNNLTAPATPLVGREDELAEVGELLRDPECRLLTLVGPPGVGKTRLGVQVAAELLGDAGAPFADGLFFVALAPIRDPALVGPTVAQVLGVRQVEGQQPLDSLRYHLRNKQVLLVLDNFEQVVEAAPLVSELLGAAPGLKVLATSRASLRVYGEHCYAVPPLALPDPLALPLLDAGVQAEAVQLFTQRAKAVKADFNLTGENAPAVAEICVRLDGLPLAIELAAARVKLLPPQKMLAQLDHSLRFLTGGPRDLPARYRTLRGTIDWSHNLLRVDERTLFRRLGVFVGGCSLEAAEAVCNASGDLDLLGGLEALVDQNLLQQSEVGGEPRFGMLETIREYALERLDASGEAGDLQRRHAEYFLALAERAAPELLGARQQDWFVQLRAKQDNLRAALAWSLGAGEAELGLRLVGALLDFWIDAGHSAEGLRWTERALASGQDAPPAARAGALHAAGWLCYAEGESRKGQTYSGEALAIYRELGDKVGSAWALVRLGQNAMPFPDECKDGIALCQEGLALFRDAGHKPGIGSALYVMGELGRQDGDYDLAQKAYEESLALSRERGYKLGELLALANMGTVAMYRGLPEQARALYAESLPLSRELGDKTYSAMHLAAIAGPVAAGGDPQAAARLLGASEALLEALGIIIPAADWSTLDRNVEAVREQLDEGTFDAAWAEGRAMSLEQAISYALEWGASLRKASSPCPGPTAEPA